MARPTDYNKGILEKAEQYESSWQLLYPDDRLPTIEGLALHINIARSTIYEWISQEGKEEFSDIFDKIMEKQGKTLVNKGLDSTFNSTITKVMMTKHGYRDAIDSDVTSKGEKIMPLQLTDEQYRQVITTTNKRSGSDTGE